MAGTTGTALNQDQHLIWNIYQEADLIVADFSVIESRLRGVDVSHPFMTLGYSLLYTKPNVTEANWFAFLKLFSMDVWLCLLVSYVATSVVLAVVYR